MNCSSLILALVDLAVARQHHSHPAVEIIKYQAAADFRSTRNSDEDKNLKSTALRQLVQEISRMLNVPRDEEEVAIIH